ncbi:hypothetical protein LSTR_LSTR001969 [Laodelphax striatellus]|uniref:Uncharacterized protein n=1 Tax=Laodelphax striatellus TaxID=195883 RepID=A0A482XI42_LAOST|nr:hypothetical protein LSTR_LSTR001969 [Laodelphax striatellus]
MDVIEISHSYKFEKREKYLSLKWKISHVMLYLTCSLIGFAGNAVVRILESSLDHECLFYSNISAVEDKNEGKWYVSPSVTVWSKHHCYRIMFIFTISFVYGMIWTVYFFTCAVSQYKYKVKRLESFHGYGPPQRLVIPALIFNVVITLATGPIAVDAWYGLVVFCQNLMKITNSSTCMEAARLIYPTRDGNNLENAKVMADLIRSQLYKERVRIWRRFLQEKGLAGKVLQSIKEIEYTFPCLKEKEDNEEEIDNNYGLDTNEAAFNLALTESSSTTAHTNPSDIDINPLHLFSTERLHLTKRRKVDGDSEIGDWVALELEGFVNQIAPVTNQDDTFEPQAHSQTPVDTVRSVDSSGSSSLKKRKDPGAGSSKNFRGTL